MTQITQHNTDYNLVNPDFIIEKQNQNGEKIYEVQIGLDEKNSTCEDINNILTLENEGNYYRIMELAYPKYKKIIGDEDFIMPSFDCDFTDKEIEFYKWCYNNGYMRKDELEDAGINIEGLIPDNSKIMEKLAAKIFGIDLDNKEQLLRSLERFNIWRRQVGFLKDDFIINYNEIKEPGLEIANNSDFKKIEAA